MASCSHYLASCSGCFLHLADHDTFHVWFARGNICILDSYVPHFASTARQNAPGELGYGSRLRMSFEGILYFRGVMSIIVVKASKHDKLHLVPSV